MASRWADGTSRSTLVPSQVRVQDQVHQAIFALGRSKRGGSPILRQLLQKRGSQGSPSYLLLSSSESDNSVLVQQQSIFIFMFVKCA